MHYENLARTLIADDSDFKSIAVSLTDRQRIELLGLATTLNHNHSGQCSKLFEPTDDCADGLLLEVVLERSLYRVAQKKGAPITVSIR